MHAERLERRICRAVHRISAVRPGENLWRLAGRRCDQSLIFLRILAQKPRIGFEVFSFFAVSALTTVTDAMQIIGMACKFHKTGAAHQRDFSPRKRAACRDAIDVVGAARAIRANQRDNSFGLILPQQGEGIGIVVAVTIIEAQNDRLSRKLGTLRGVSDEA